MSFTVPPIPTGSPLDVARWSLDVAHRAIDDAATGATAGGEGEAIAYAHLQAASASALVSIAASLERIANDLTADEHRLDVGAILPSRPPAVRRGSSLHVGGCPRSNPDPDLPLSVECTCRRRPTARPSRASTSTRLLVLAVVLATLLSSCVWGDLADCEADGRWHVDAFHDGGLHEDASTPDHAVPDDVVPPKTVGRRVLEKIREAR